MFYDTPSGSPRKVLGLASALSHGCGALSQCHLLDAYVGFSRSSLVASTHFEPSSLNPASSRIASSAAFSEQLEGLLVPKKHP